MSSLRPDIVFWISYVCRLGFEVLTSASLTLTGSFMMDRTKSRGVNVRTKIKQVQRVNVFIRGHKHGEKYDAL